MPRKNKKRTEEKQEEFLEETEVPTTTLPKTEIVYKTDTTELGKEIISAIDELKESMKEMKSMIEEYKKSPEPVIHSNGNQEGTPIPADYTNAVNTILNQKFGLKIEYPDDGNPQMNFTIVVPQEYSSLKQDEWNRTKADLRTKVITFAEGLNGVRDWCTKVYLSFPNETQAKIQQDRINVRI